MGFNPAYKYLLKMKRKLIRLTETDIVKIVKNLITENTASDTNRLEVNFSGTFPSGQFDEKYLNVSEFKKNMSTILEFVKTHPDAEIEINVIGGESQVKNPKGFEEKGSLAKKRCQIISSKIKESLELNHINLETIQFKVAQPVIGSTPYQRGDDVHRNEYTNEQFIKVVISVVAEDAQPSWCSSQDEGTGRQGDPNNGFVSDYKRYDLKGDVGSIILKFDPVEVPDMFVVRYNNQTYNTGFIGNGDLTYRVKIASVLATHYQGKDKPEHFKGITVSNLEPGAWSEFERAMASDYDTYANFVEDFAPILPIDINKYRNWKQFRRSEEFKKIVWADMTPLINKGSNDIQLVSGYRQLTIPKVRGVSLLELWVVGPMGTTRWRVKFSCEGKPDLKPPK
jgi:hypothetical protein